MRPRFTPVLFDLDGTLIDSGKDIASAVNVTLDGLGLPRLAEDEIIGYVGDGVRKLTERTLRRFGRDDVDAVVRDIKAAYRERCLVHTRPYPGVADLLADLQGVPTAVVTNKVSEFSRRILDGLGLAPLVDAVVGGDETGKLKPHPDPLRLACRRLGVDPGGGVMVGDHQNDVLAGRAAGMATCGVAWGFDRGAGVRTARPDRLCPDIPELRRFLFEP
jgi:phosphoglycolate phosphatase